MKAFKVLVTSSLFPSLNGDQNQNKNDRMHNSDEIVEPYHPSAIESVNDSTSNSSNSHYVYDEAIDDEFTMSHDTPFPIPPMDLSHAFQFLQQANLCANVCAWDSIICHLKFLTLHISLYFLNLLESNNVK